MYQPTAAGVYARVHDLSERVSTAHGHYATNGTRNMHIIIITIQTYVIIPVPRYLTVCNMYAYYKSNG